MTNRLILASESPRRYSLLKQVGLDFDVIPSQINEDIIFAENPEQYVIRIANKKALEVGSRYPENWVIAADTIVYIDNSILGKPKDTKEAKEMLLRLSGRQHSVFTGISICNLRKGKTNSMAVKTFVKMKNISPSEIEWYVNTEEPYDKAGGYAVQGIGSILIESIYGSYTNVIGLPLCELFQMLMQLGAIEISPLGIKII